MPRLYGVSDGEDETLDMVIALFDELEPAEEYGGPGSGHHGHAGRPGSIGGSSSGEGMPSGHAERAQANRIGGGVGFAEVPASSFVRQRNEHLADKYKPFVTAYTSKEYGKMGARCFVSETGQSGFALKPDGDIVSVFSAAGSGEGKHALLSAIANGGSKLDCFDGFLSQKFYPSFGFKEYDRWTWDDQYAPAGWNYDEFGRPDVVFLRLGE